MAPAATKTRGLSRMQAEMPLGDFLVAYLNRLGVRHIFGLPGDLVLGLFHRFGRAKKGYYTAVMIRIRVLARYIHAGDRYDPGHDLAHHLEAPTLAEIRNCFKDGARHKLGLYKLNTLKTRLWRC